MCMKKYHHPTIDLQKSCLLHHLRAHFFSWLLQKIGQLIANTSDSKDTTLVRGMHIAYILSTDSLVAV